MAIRVAFNATPLLSPLTGIGNYIVELGAASVDPLLNLCQESDNAVDVAFALAALRVRDPRVLAEAVQRGGRCP